MTQYIDKADLVAEIENWIKEASHRYILSKVQFSLSDRIKSLENLLSFLDTLEVRDVLEESVSNDLEAELIKWHNNHFKKKNTFVGMSGFYLTNNNQLSLANHFAQWQKERLTDKAVKWLTLHDSYSKPTNVLVEDFRKAMEEE